MKMICRNHLMMRIFSNLLRRKTNQASLRQNGTCCRTVSFLIPSSNLRLIASRCMSFKPSPFPFLAKNLSVNVIIDLPPDDDDNLPDDLSLPSLGSEQAAFFFTDEGEIDAKTDFDGSYGDYLGNIRRSAARSQRSSPLIYLCLMQRIYQIPRRIFTTRMSPLTTITSKTVICRHLTTKVLTLNPSPHFFFYTQPSVHNLDDLPPPEEDEDDLPPPPEEDADEGYTSRPQPKPHSPGRNRPVSL